MGIKVKRGADAKARKELKTQKILIFGLFSDFAFTKNPAPFHGEKVRGGRKHACIRPSISKHLVEPVVHPNRIGVSG